MQSKDIRQSFLDFFAEKSHQIVPSAPMIIKGDPTLMFTNAGMNQFKDVFLGNKAPLSSRIADTQKCLRVSGKHNDLEEVGHDTYHHTMFEMLGNWSFGDYFKKEAINWGYEFLVERLGISKEDLYVTVFEGDKEDGVDLDTEALELWKEKFPESQILYGNKKDNFWEMGAQGPCGPCSEIHIDIRSAEEKKKLSGAKLVNLDHPQVIEIWNLVFIQYNRKADGSLENLPQKHVDTGMGFERLCMVKQGVQSNYDTDVFQPMIQQLAAAALVKYGEDEQTDIALRVIADHIRAIAFSIADGQLPSNNKAGYVIRRILRRAIRYGYTFLNFREAFIHSLVPMLVKDLGEAYPELVRNKDLIINVIRSEEETFLNTLAKGLNLINKISDTIKAENKDTVDGKVAFELYDTYGFPLDLTELILSEQGLKVDLKAFDTEMQKQKQRSRTDAAKETDDWVVLSEAESEFIGYNNTTAEVSILKYRKQIIKKKEVYQLVFNQTPFYAESGGQIGDSGHIETNGEKIFISDTQKENNLIVHFTDKLPSTIDAKFTAVVNADKRLKITNNHSVTHLLHKALREVLGEHVEQKGSLVTDKALRFDFSHFNKMTTEEIQLVEKNVNAAIRKNSEADIRIDVSMDTAIEMGAMALFGEKYGDKVRVVKFDDSVELCGGTHVGATGQIGSFIIKQETSIAAGIRRIEAISGDAAEAFMNEKRDTVDNLKVVFKNQKDLVKAAEQLVAQNKELQKKVEQLNDIAIKQQKQEMLNKFKEVKGVNLLASLEKSDINDLKKIAQQLISENTNTLIVFGTVTNGKPNICVGVSKDLIESKGLNAGTIIRELAKEIQGGGGGQPHLATAGGKKADGIDKVFDKILELL
ncbi:MAG: alanine--tRNA ligase [Bacteroidetes bacterium 4572_112]|nr:MAG: alanine--tRNA ligase [Bacteroidetes bacterium 4572_112]